MYFDNPITEITQRALYPLISADVTKFLSGVFSGRSEFVAHAYETIASVCGIEHDTFRPDDFRTEVWMSPGGRMCALIGFPEAVEEYDCSVCALAVNRDGTVHGFYLMEKSDSDLFLIMDTASEATPILAISDEKDQSKHMEILKSHIA